MRKWKLNSLVLCAIRTIFVAFIPWLTWKSFQKNCTQHKKLFFLLRKCFTRSHVFSCSFFYNCNVVAAGIFNKKINILLFKFWRNILKLRRESQSTVCVWIYSSLGNCIFRAESFFLERQFFRKTKQFFTDVLQRLCC